MFVYASSRTSALFCGYSARMCRNCQTVQPHACTEKEADMRVYGIPVQGMHPTGVETTCLFCGQFEVYPPGERIVADRGWIPGQSLQALIDVTDPSLGVVGNRTTYTKGELLALARRAELQALAKVTQGPMVLVLLLASFVVPICIALILDFVVIARVYPQWQGATVGWLSMLLIPVMLALTFRLVPRLFVQSRFNRAAIDILAQYGATTADIKTATVGATNLEDKLRTLIARLP